MIDKLTPSCQFILHTELLGSRGAECELGWMQLAPGVWEYRRDSRDTAQSLSDRVADARVKGLVQTCGEFSLASGIRLSPPIMLGIKLSKSLTIEGSWAHKLQAGGQTTIYEFYTSQFWVTRCQYRRFVKLWRCYREHTRSCSNRGSCHCPCRTRC